VAGSCAGPAASLPKLYVRRRSSESPIDRRLNEVGAEVEVSSGVGLEANSQTACAFSRDQAGFRDAAIQVNG